MKIKTIMPQVRGLGDVVAKVAQPVAKAIDAVAGTDLKNCGGCKRRQETLNRKFPMKNIIALTILLVCATWSAIARDWTYSTNLFAGFDYTTNVFYGEGPMDTNRDDWLVFINKINHNDNWLAGKVAELEATGGSSGGLTNFGFTNTVTLPPGSQAYVTNVGTFGGIAYYQVGVPAGAPGTNTVTAYNLSNAIYSSRRYMTYTTNYAFWSASNYLARVDGIVRFNLVPGSDGGNPPMNIPVKLMGSYTGTNNWFQITNGFWTSNTVTVVLLTNGLSAAGLAQVTPGSCTLYALDHWELKGRTNWLDDQSLHRTGTAESDDDFVTFGEMNSALANITDHNLTKRTETNGIYHLIYSSAGREVFDISSFTAWVTISSCVRSGSELVLGIYQTNLTSNWFLESTTDLALKNWQTWTNYTVATNGDVVELTVPINPETIRFFTARGHTTNSFAIHSPLLVESGLTYPSNTWDLATITNRLTPGSIWTGNSNGSPGLVTIWRSNSAACYYLLQSNGVTLRLPVP